MVIKFTLMVIGLLSIWSSTYAQNKIDSWNEFAKTKFDPKFDENLNEYFFAPTFSTSLTTLQGKEITLAGYYVPFAAEKQNYIVISRVPMSQCFFCGGSGPESVAEVFLVKATRKFKVDDQIKVKGRLKLNSKDPDHVNFILTDAVLIE